MNNFVTAIVNENFDSYQRLARMRQWHNEYLSPVEYEKRKNEDITCQE